MRPTNRIPGSREGSIYLIVLVTITVVTTMILTGVSLRLTSASRYRLNNESSVARKAARSAVESALAICDDPTTFLANAKTGTLIAETSVGGSTISAIALDKDTGLRVTDSTSNISITATGQSGDAKTMIGFDLNQVNGYKELLASMGSTSYWPLDEVKTSTVAEDVFSGIDGAYLDPDMAGNVEFLDLDDAPHVYNEKDVIEIPHDASFEVMNGTVMLWVKLGGVHSNRTQTILSKENDHYVDVSQLIAYRNSKLYLVIYSLYSPIDRSIACDGTPLEDKEWHHIAYSFGMRGAALYIDGVRVLYDESCVTGLSYDYGSYAETNREPWVLGGRGYWGAYYDALDGYVARFAFVPSQLSTKEINELMVGQTKAMKFAPVDGSFARVVE